MTSALIPLAGSFIGTNRAYIYILFSKDQHFAYVGETCGESGVISRLCGHVRTGRNMGTLRSRLLEKKGINLDDAEDLHLYTYWLPQEPRFTGLEKVYRRGVEYLVQKKLWEVCGSLNPYLHIVSYVEPSDATSLTVIKDVAQAAFNGFLAEYSV